MVKTLYFNDNIEKKSVQKFMLTETELFAHFVDNSLMEMFSAPNSTNFNDIKKQPANHSKV